MPLCTVQCYRSLGLYPALYRFAYLRMVEGRTMLPPYPALSLALSRSVALSGCLVPSTCFHRRYSTRPMPSPSTRRTHASTGTCCRMRASSCEWVENRTMLPLCGSLCPSTALSRSRALCGSLYLWVPCCVWGCLALCYPYPYPCLSPCTYGCPTCLAPSIGKGM